MHLHKCVFSNISKQFRLKWSYFTEIKYNNTWGGGGGSKETKSMAYLSQNPNFTSFLIYQNAFLIFAVNKGLFHSTKSKVYENDWKLRRYAALTVRRSPLDVRIWVISNGIGGGQSGADLWFEKGGGAAGLGCSPPGFFLLIWVTF